jgi:hypothetical protein
MEWAKIMRGKNKSSRMKGRKKDNKGVVRRIIHTLSCAGESGRRDEPGVKKVRHGLVLDFSSISFCPRGPLVCLLFPPSKSPLLTMGDGQIPFVVIVQGFARTTRVSFPLFLKFPLREDLAIVKPLLSIGIDMHLLDV